MQDALLRVTFLTQCSQPVIFGVGKEKEPLIITNPTDLSFSLLYNHYVWFSYFIMGCAAILHSYKYYNIIIIMVRMCECTDH